VEAIAVFGLFPYLAPLIEQRGEGGATEAGLALGGFAIGGLIYSAFVKWMLARLGLKRMLIGGGVIAAVSLAAIGMAGSWQLDALAMVCLGLGFYMLHNSFQTQVTEVAPTARASAVALHAFSFFVGQALGVVVFGAGLRTIGLFPTMAMAAVTICSLGLVAAFALTRPAQPLAR
jgi:predicted MFS family arabinose efflux permease